eukprot:738211-Hanusia_phi.AAC.3
MAGGETEQRRGKKVDEGGGREADGGRGRGGDLEAELMYEAVASQSSHFAAIVDGMRAEDAVAPATFPRTCHLRPMAERKEGGEGGEWRGERRGSRGEEGKGVMM